MKTKFKLFAIALVAIIGFSMTALSMTTCSDGGDENGTGTAPAITTASLPSGTVGTVYNQTLAATGDAPITWSIGNGALPTGLNLSSTGVISGTPTAVNTFNFTVKATNATGSGTKALSIVIAAADTPDLTGDITITPNDDVQIETELTATYSGSETVSYQWKKDGVDVGENADTYTPTQAGTYTVTVSAEGYKSKTSAAVDVGDPNLPDLTGDITITPNDDVQIETELTATYSGSETVTYHWKKDGVDVGENADTYTPTQAGTYTVTVSAAGYNPKTSGAVVVTAPVVTPDLTGDITITPNSGVQTNTELTANYSGSETVTYQWKKGGVDVGENADTYTPTQAGSYTVTVSAEGYKSKTSAAVDVGDPNLPDLTGDINITPNSGVQTNTELTATYGGSETVTYQWKKDGVNVGANSNKFTPTQAGTYTVTVSAAGYNPKTSGAVVVTAPVVTPDLSGTITITPNSGVQTNTELTANYSGSETVTYQWKKDGANVGTNTNKYTPTTAGSYTVTVSAAGYNNKTSTAVVVTASVVTPDLTGDINISPNSGVQTNTELTANYSGSETVTYQWKKGGENVGANSNKFTPTQAGSYTVTVSAAGYKPKTSGAVVVTGGSSMATAIPLTLNIWADGNLPVSGEQWFTFTATADTQYIHASFDTLTSLYVQVYDSSGAAVGNQERLYYLTKYISRTVATGQTYYIKVTPYLSSYSGTYQIAFNTSTEQSSIKTTLPTTGITTLTLNQWADGNLPSGGEQWFTFTATASTQYIHASFGTLASLWVQVYDSSGATVGDRTELYSSIEYISRTVSTGQTYYIKVTPYGSGYSGTYKIGFNTSIISLGVTPTALTLNQWADGNLPANGEQWFTFTATASTQYIHASFGTLSNLYVQVYDSSGAAVGGRTYLGSDSSNKYIARTVSTGQTYYIKVTPYGSGSGGISGTYQIGFNTSTTLPITLLPSVNVTTLTLNQWADGNLPANGEQWFSFTATASTQYIHASFGALTNLYVQVYNSSGAAVGDRTNLSSSSSDKYISRTVSTGQTYYIKVTPYGSGSGGISGTYQIAFNTGGIPPGVTPTALTFDTWADGNPYSGGEQWFSFTATASTQYIHASFGTLRDLYVQVYDSSGAAVGARTYLFGSSGTTNYTPRTVSTGQTYYIKVTPYGSGSTYKISFNTSATLQITLPTVNVTTLTLNTWADGNLPLDGGEQWFSFTATADTQYIHASFGTLTTLYVQVYNSSGVTVGDRTNLYNSGSYKYYSPPVSTGQTYYIKVTPYGSGYIGTYKIGFTASSQPTFNVVPLTINTWADGNLPANGEQWFTFTTTASPQYIHASFGTLTDLYVQVYNSSGATVGDRTRLNSSTKYISRTVSTGQTYYIKVTPYSSSGSGTYKIGFTASSQPTFNVVPLTLNTWADGNLPANGEQWFTFTATASPQYIHVSFGTLTSLYVQVYDSDGYTVNSQSNLTSSSTNKYISRTVSTGQTYYIKVTPYSSSGSGTYQIAFNAIPTAPGAATPTALTLNTWADGNLPLDGEQWFTFTATAGTQYIHASFGALTSLYVQVYDSGGTTVNSQSNLTSSSTNKYISRTVSTGQTYYIKVTPYSSSGSGTYQIAFNTGGIPPGGVISTALTLNQWANGNLPANGEQWFTFTATAGTQYIHASFDTWDYILTEFYVQVYDSSGAAVGDITYLGYDNRYTSRTVSTEQTYYIKVTPTSRSYSGTYKIAFNTVLFPPGATPTALTLDTWANGNLPANGEQWFTFTATASTQWIHVSLGTLTIFYVQVYDSSGNRVGDDKEFTSSSSSYSISRTVSTGQTYYIRVKIPGALSGTYKIGFNTSNYEPFN